MIEKYWNKLTVWWMCLAPEQIAFYLINTPAQILVIFIPILVLEKFGDVWWEANPGLMDAMWFPFIFGWLTLFFCVRWLISALIILYYSDIEVDFSE